jgi:predicted TIM-barrel fold metal-dependent hydrolase
VARYPKRFVGSIVLPLQDDAALGELERGVAQLGLKVVTPGRATAASTSAIRCSSRSGPR